MACRHCRVVRTQLADAPGLIPVRMPLFKELDVAIVYGGLLYGIGHFAEMAIRQNNSLIHDRGYGLRLRAVFT